MGRARVVAVDVPAVTCPTCGWIVTDEYVDQTAESAHRSPSDIARSINDWINDWLNEHVAPEVYLSHQMIVMVRCPECNEMIPEKFKVEDARRRIRAAHDDLDVGGVCTQCGRLHTATVLLACPTCGEPDETPILGHHHCPGLALVKTRVAAAS